MRRPGRPRTKLGPPSCMGGHTVLSAAGYVLEYLPRHPACSKRGYVLQHRLVMEMSLGRHLAGTEIVHHRDEDKANNSLDNLELLPSPAAHQALHNKMNGGPPNKYDLTEDEVREALQGRSTLVASRLLGCHHQTLRNRFDHLLGKRRSPHSPSDHAVIEQVRKAAADPSLGVKPFAKQTGIAAQVVKLICEENGIHWVRKSRKGEKHRPRRKTPSPPE